MDHKKGGTVKASYEVDSRNSRIWIDVTSSFSASMQEAVRNGWLNNYEEYNHIRYQASLKFNRLLDNTSYRICEVDLKYDVTSGRFYAYLPTEVLSAYGDKKLELLLRFSERNSKTRISTDYESESEVNLGYMENDPADIPVIRSLSYADNGSAITITVNVDNSSAGADSFYVGASYYESDGGEALRIINNQYYGNVITIDRSEVYIDRRYEEQKVRDADYLVFDVTPVSGSLYGQSQVISVKLSDGSVSYHLPGWKPDKSAPTGGKLAAVQSENEILLTVSGFKDNVGVEYFEFYLNGVEIDSGIASQSVYHLAEGQAGKLEFSVIAYDLAGNASKAVKSSVTVKDMTQPVFGKFSPAAVVSDAKGGTITFRSDAAADNVGVAAYSVEIYKAGTAVGVSKPERSIKCSIGKDGTVTAKVPKLKAGEYIYRIAAADKNKNTAYSESFDLSVTDGTAPSGGKLAAVQSGNEIILTVSGFKDNVGVEYFEFYLNGVEIDSGIASQSVYRLAEGQAGKLEFSVIAYDLAGNSSKAVKKSVTVKDMTKPVFGEFSSEASVNSVKGGTITFRSDAAADNVGVTAYSVEIYKAGAAVGVSKPERSIKCSIGKDGTVTAKVPKLAAGEYIYRIAAADKSKNTAYSEIFELSVADGAAPVVKKAEVERVLNFANIGSGQDSDDYDSWLCGEENQNLTEFCGSGSAADAAGGADLLLSPYDLGGKFSGAALDGTIAFAADGAILAISAAEEQEKAVACKMQLA